MSEDYKHQMGQTISDFFSEQTLEDGTLAFDHTDARDIDILVDRIVKESGGLIPVHKLENFIEGNTCYSSMGCAFCNSFTCMHCKNTAYVEVDDLKLLIEGKL